MEDVLITNDMMRKLRVAIDRKRENSTHKVEDYDIRWSVVYPTYIILLYSNINRALPRTDWASVVFVTLDEALSYIKEVDET